MRHLLFLDELRVLPADAYFARLFGRGTEDQQRGSGAGLVELHDRRPLRAALFRLSGGLLLAQTALLYRLPRVRALLFRIPLGGYVGQPDVHPLPPRQQPPPSPPGPSTSKASRASLSRAWTTVW